MLPRRVQPALGRPLLALFRHQAHGMRLVAQGDGLHLGGGGTFEVQRNGNPRHQRLDIRIADMTAIFAQVRRDPVGSCGLCQHGGGQCAVAAVTAHALRATLQTHRQLPMVPFPPPSLHLMQFVKP